MWPAFCHLTAQTVFATALAGSVVCWSAGSLADGALAVGLPADVARSGVAFGVAINHENTGLAEAKAIEHCQRFENAPASTKALCKVVQPVQGECVAIAIDREDGTPGVGWAVSKDQDAAEAEAEAKCISTATKEREKFCTIVISCCDGRGPWTRPFSRGSCQPRK